MQHNLDSCDWSQLAFEESAKTRQLYQNFLKSRKRNTTVSRKQCAKCFAPLRGKLVKTYEEKGYVHYCDKCREDKQ